jgi:hypothetical protein
MALLESYYTINQAVGVGMAIQKDGGVLLDSCQVMVRDKQLHLEKRVSGITDPAALSKHFDTKIPIALNLSGKGILYRQFPGATETGPINFSAVLPHANAEDFYIQYFHSGGSLFVAVIRKTDADKWIGLLREQGFNILMLSLGPFPVKNIVPQLNVYGEELRFNGHIIDRDEELNWRAYRYEESAGALFALKIGIEPISQQLLLPYAAAFQLVLSARLEVVQAQVPEMETALDLVLGDKQFRVKGFLILVCCFLLLLVNFFIFSWLYSANDQLTMEVGRSVRSTRDWQALKDTIRGKEALLTELGWDGGISKSRLISQIGALLPPEITWQEVTVNPVDPSGIRNKRSLQFFNRRMEIRGGCPQIIPVNEWIARIKTKTWVKEIRLESYTYNNELNTGQFTLMITY